MTSMRFDCSLEVSWSETMAASVRKDARLLGVSGGREAVSMMQSVPSLWPSMRSGAPA